MLIRLSVDVLIEETTAEVISETRNVRYLVVGGD
jgi:hypothetical protein